MVCPILVFVQVEAYQRRYGFYPEAVAADPVYGTQKNRAHLKDKDIPYAGKALGLPKKVTEQNREQLKRDKQQRQADYRQGIPIEGKFSQGIGLKRLMKYFMK